MRYLQAKLFTEFCDNNDNCKAPTKSKILFQKNPMIEIVRSRERLVQGAKGKSVHISIQVTENRTSRL